MTNLTNHTEFLQKYDQMENTTKLMCPTYFVNTVVIDWTPCLFLWLASPLVLYQIKTSRNNVVDTPWNWLNKSKMVLLGILIACCVADSIFPILYRSKVSASTLMDQFSSLINFITFILAFIITANHSRRGMKSSGIMFLFWLLYLTCGTLQLPSVLAQDTRMAETFHKVFRVYIFYPAVLLSFIMSFFPEPNLITSKLQEKENNCPEKTSSFPSQMTFTWAFQLVRKGYHTTLELRDMWTLDTKNALGNVYEGKDGIGQLSEIVHQISDSVKEGKGLFLFPLIKAFGSTYAIAACLRFFYDLLSYSNAFLLTCVIDSFTLNSTNSDDFNEYGRQSPSYFWAVIMLLNGVIIAVLKYQHQYRVRLLYIRVQSSLFSAIYRKVLRISPSAQKERTVGDVVNLLAVDVTRIYNTISYVHNLWSAPVIVSLSLWYLWSYFGPLMLMGIAILMVSLFLNAVIAENIRRLQLKQMKLKDKRIKLTCEILAGIKVVKMNAWEAGFQKKVITIREKEMQKLKKIALFETLSTLVSICSGFLIIFGVIFMYIKRTDPEVDSHHSVIILSLQMFSVLQQSLHSITFIVTYFSQFNVSLKRVNDFFNSAELKVSTVDHNISNGNAVSIVKGDFSWGSHTGDTITLENINLQVKDGSLVFVIGDVGSGKSSLLSAILGEMYKIHGHVSAKKTKAYLSQQVWIQNGTIRDNILFGQPYDENLFNDVVHACALGYDWDSLIGHDMTEIGEQGVNLSGGQKQRIALARAVYTLKNSELYLLDDPLSAFDTFVAKHVYDSVIGHNGLLKDKTRIVTTHSNTFLQDADMIIVLKDGRIKESGTFKELLDTNKGNFSNYIKNTSGIQQQDADIPFADQDDYDNLPEHRVPESLPLENNCFIQSNVTRKESFQDGAVDKLIQKERAETGKVKLAVYKYYLKSMGLHLAALVVCLEIIPQLLIILLFEMHNIWNKERSCEKDIACLKVYVVLGILYGIALFIAKLRERWALLSANSKLLYSMLGGVLNAPLCFTDTNPCGRIIARFSQDVDILDYILPSQFHKFISSTFAVMMFSMYVVSTFPSFLLAEIPIIIFFIFIMFYYIATSQQLRRLESVTRSPIYSHLSETYKGVDSVRAYNAEDRFIRKFEANVDSNQRCNFPLYATNMWVRVWVEFCGVLILFLTIVTAEYYKESTVAVNYAVLYFSTMVVDFLQSSVLSAAEIETNIVAVERTKEYSEIPEEGSERALPRNHSHNKEKMCDGRCAVVKKPEEDFELSEVTYLMGSDKNANEGDEIPKDWPNQGKVEFRKYQTRYRMGKPLVLLNLNFVIQPGERIGLVGRTGAGKTSLALALFRILEADKGDILIDGVNISKLQLRTLRSRLNIVPQDPVLFTGSLRFNIDPLGNHTDSDIESAVNKVHLNHFGLDFIIEDAGENLSVGQKQLICLARALLHKTKVLILDEATAAMDLEMDNQMKNIVKSEFKDCTVILIAHRHNTIEDCNRVLIMENRTIKEL